MERVSSGWKKTSSKSVSSQRPRSEVEVDIVREDRGRWRGGCLGKMDVVTSLRERGLKYAMRFVVDVRQP